MLNEDRRGLTLIELMISLSLAGVVLSLFASISLRQQRVFADMSDRVALSAQLRDASAIVPIDLRALTPRSGDVREARDTSIEVRATIGGGVVCDSAAAAIVLAPAIPGPASFASFAASTEVGDSAWVLAATDSGERWIAYGVTAVDTAAAGSCAPGGPLTDSTTARTRLTLDRAPPASLGMPVRITRPVRYSVYRASDNQWYFGEREWSNTTARFSTIQPVAGPLLAASSGGLVFTYLDSTGVVLATPVADTRVIALVRVQLVGQTRNVTRALGAAGTATRRGDTAVVAVALRNRR